MGTGDLISQNANLIFKAIILVIILVIIIVIIKIVQNAVKKAKRAVRQITQPINDVSNILKLANQIQEEEPDVKSVGGMTSIYLKQIQKDYPDYHNNDAEDSVKTFLNEYLRIKYSGESGYKQAKIGERVDIYMDKLPKGSLSNIRHNGIAIYDYKKAREYATVTYRVSVGFNYNGKRIETRYEVDYTIQLRNSEVASVNLKCPNCGGPYSSMNDTECPYCGAGIIRDTLMSWYITDAKEIL